MIQTPGFCPHSAAVTAARLASGLPVSAAALAHLAQTEQRIRSRS